MRSDWVDVTICATIDSGELLSRLNDRCARRRRSRFKSAHGRETVSAQCLLNDARTTLGEVRSHQGWAGEKSDFFSILLGQWGTG